MILDAISIKNILNFVSNWRRSHISPIMGLLLLLISTSLAHAQSSLILWEKTLDIDVGKNKVWLNQSAISDNGNLVLAGSGTSDSNRYRSRQKKLNFAAMLSSEGEILWKRNLDTVTIVPTSKIISNSDSSLSFLGYSHVNANAHAPIKSQTFNLHSDGRLIGSSPGSADVAAQNIIQHDDGTYTFVETYDHVHKDPRTDVSTFEPIYKEKNGKRKVKKVKRLKDKTFSIPFLEWASSVKLPDGHYIFAGIETDYNPRGKDSYYLTSIKTDQAGGVINKTRVKEVRLSAKVISAIVDETGNTIFLMLNSDSFGNRKNSGVLTIVDENNGVVSSKETKNLKWIASVSGDGFLGGIGSSFSKYSSTGHVEWTKPLQTSGVSINTASQDNSGKVYLSGEKQGRAFVAKVSMSAISENVAFDDSLSRQYFVSNVKNIDSLKQYYSDVVANCDECDLDEITSSSLKFTTGSPAEAKAFIFKPYFDQQLFSQEAAMMYIGQLQSVSDIPSFTENVLSLCPTCDKQAVLKRLYYVHDFGQSLDANFFDSTEYNYVLRDLAYEETVEAYFNHAVKGPQNFQEFFTTILPKCESNCNETDYAKRALRKLDENDMRLNVSTFSSGPIFQHVVSTLPIEISANTDGDDFKVKLRSDGRVFSQTFKGECNYSRKATKVKDAGFLDTLFTGADARRNFYDVYKCKTKTQDMDSMNRFLTAVGKPSEYKKFEDKGKWDYYKYTGDEKIVYERSPSTYTPAPSYESSSSSSKSSPKRSGSVTAINRNGNTTTIKCSIGKDTRVTSNGSGKCTDNYIFGSYTCSYLIEEAKKRCESR